MEKVTGHKAKMWGTGIVGFGKYHYKYESGHEGDSCIAGFAPRKGNIAIYTGLYLDGEMGDINKDVLAQIIDKGVKNVMKKYPS